jgi:hypothetical protein
MNLDEAQRKKVAEWIGQGLKLSEIQNRMSSELGLNLTYMDVRLLVAELKLTPKDTEPRKTGDSLLTAASKVPASPAGTPSTPQTPQAQVPESEESYGGPGGVSVSVDQIARAGAVVSGKVTFSDGNTATWYFDQTGRLGLSPQQPGYRPPAADLQQFQMTLESELARMGF